jgi:hypothetical protein
MELAFSYNKKKVIQALRYHFISRREIRIMLILVNVFAVVSAVLLYLKKIRPEPFLLGSVTWLLLMTGVWYILPYSIYKSAATFKDNFRIAFNDADVRLENSKGYVNWEWSRFSKFFETPHFFHLYFDAKTFFLVPKDDMDEDFRHGLWELLNKKIGGKA